MLLLNALNLQYNPFNPYLNNDNYDNDTVAYVATTHIDKQGCFKVVTIL